MKKRLWLKGSLVAAVWFLFIFALVPRGQAAPQPVDPGIRYQFSQVAEKVLPAVVTVRVEQTVKSQPFAGFPDDQSGDDFFHRFFGTPQGDTQSFRQHGMGSGVIVSSDGFILTNNHVVGRADEISVSVSGRKEPLKAKVIGTDSPTDLAVIKVDAADLPAAKLGNSDSVRIGEWVLAVGAPFQLEHSVTGGIISAKGRSRVGIADYEDFIQTDAAINPGNSGGALVNLVGEVIGINTAIATQTGVYAGVGFAIPINMAKKIMQSLIAEGRVVRGFLGVSIQEVTPEIKEALKTDEGVLVGGVQRGTPADRAGLKPGDVILEFQGKKYTDIDALRSAIAETPPGTKAAFRILRKEGVKTLTVLLAEKPSTQPVALREKPSEEVAESKLGLSAKRITPELAQEMDLSQERGVVITTVKPGSPAAEAGLRAGDVILQINRVAVQALADYQDALKDLKPNAAVAFLVKRGDTTQFVSMRVPG